MRQILISLLLIFSTCALAEEYEVTPQQVSRIFDEKFSVNIIAVPDLVDREYKVASCATEYIEKSIKRTSVIPTKNNLYNLMNNFDQVISKIQGKKFTEDDVPYEERLEALARIQCEVYYSMGVLK